MPNTVLNGPQVCGSLRGDRMEGLMKASFWWKGVSLLCPSSSILSDWCALSCSKVVGNRM